MGRLLLDNFRAAITALWGNKIRSFLTMLGIIIGVFSIITLIGIGQGVKKDVTNEVTELGSNLLIVLPGQVSSESGGFNPSASLGASTLTEEDLSALAKLPEIIKSTPLSLLAGLPSANGAAAPATLALAVEPSYFDLMNTAPLVAGRFLTQEDLDEKSAVVVLDSAPRKKLFPDLTADQTLGKTINFSGHDFIVVGNIETPPSSGVFGGSGISNAMFVPYTTAKSLIHNTQIFRIVVQVDPEKDVKQVANLVRSTIKALHNNTEDFTVFTQDDLLKIINSIVNLITAAITGIGSISLIVGGIGIMNIMLVSVTERTKEIGLRKAIGASNGAILSQFLLEAVVLSLIGGGLGVLLSVIVSIPIHAQAGITVAINGTSAGIAFLFSFVVGVIFGVAPAIRAARLNPIDALRYE